MRDGLIDEETGLDVAVDRPRLAERLVPGDGVEAGVVSLANDNVRELESRRSRFGVPSVS